STPFFFSYSVPPPHLHSFPTRRSSDLPTLPYFSTQSTTTPISTLHILHPAYPKPILLDLYRHLFIFLTCTWQTPPSLLTSQFLRSEEHTSELQSRGHLVCRLLLEKKNN